MTEPIDRDRLLDHDYDGIREYDNPMPKWWVWIFVGTVVYCLPYVMWYHWGKGPSIQDEYQAELTAYAEKLLATYGELTPDEPTILRYMNDEIAMTAMASRFKSKCAQCHLADGSGNVGPNLTDDHWINVKTITDIPRVIREGVIAKGMPSWEGKLTNTEITLLAAYVARLSRHPVTGGKPPQGDVIPPWPAAPPSPPPDGSTAGAS